MRKFPLIVLLVLGLGLAAARPQFDSPSTVSGTLGGAAETILSLLPVHTDEAMAQQMKFREVPPESAKRIDRSRARRTAATPDVTEPTEPTEPANPPEPADLPDSPDRYTSRSSDVVRIGHDVHVEKDELVEGDLVVLGGDVVVDGHVEGDVVAMGGDVQLNATGRVDGDVACIGGHLTQEEGASVGGQRFTASGFRDFARQKARARASDDVDRRSRRVVSKIMNVLMLVAVAWGFAALAPGRTQGSLDMLKRQPAASLGVGALVFALIIPSVIALALIVVILCITIVGIPLALAALLGYVLFLLLMYIWGFAVISSWVGEWTLSRRAAHTGMAAGVATQGIPPTLVRKAVTGALILAGAGFAGEFLKTIGPFHALGVLLVILSSAALAVGVTFGGGAWLRNEFATGLLGRLWRGRRGGGAGAAAPPVNAPHPPSTPPGVVSPPVAPPPSWSGTPPPPAAGMPAADPEAPPPPQA